MATHYDNRYSGAERWRQTVRDADRDPSYVQPTDLTRWREDRDIAVLAHDFGLSPDKLRALIDKANARDDNR